VVPLLNRPFLAYQLALLRAHGVTDAVLACGYRVEDVSRALGEETAGVRLRYRVEKEPLGTGGAVRHAADLTRGLVFVLNGDVLTDADLGAMREAHQARGAAVSLFLTRVADPRPYGVVEIDERGRVRRFREKPGPDEPLAADTINAGVYLIDADLLRRMPADRPVSIEREFFPGLIADGVPCYGWVGAAYWRDIGSPAAYRAAQMDLLDGRVRTPLRPPGVLRDGVWVGDGAAVAGATLLAPAVVGAGTRIEAGARVGPRAVLGARCRVGRDACVREAVLWDDVEVGAAAVLEACVVAAGARVGAGARLGPDVVLEPGAVVGEGARIGPGGAC
jgi:mannose-1-phosphate guanylyltransferase